MLEASWVEDVRTQLKRLAVLLGAVRDTDVFAERFRTLAQRLPAESAKTVDPILAHLRGIRETAYSALVVEMSAFWYVSLTETLAAAVQDVDGHRVAVPNVHVQPRVVIAQLMRPAWQKLAGAVHRAGLETDAAQLHRIRIRAKSCRYAAEAIGPFVSSDRRAQFERFMHHIARLQERLGSLHDIVIGQNMLRTLSGVNSSLIDEIVELESATADEMQTAWLASWRKLRRHRSRFW